MIKGSYEELKDLAKNYVCRDHLTPLTVAWSAQENSHVLRCGEGHFPEEITRQPSLTELHKQGVELPEPIKHNVEKGMARHQQQKALSPQARTMGGVSAVDLGTGELLLPEVVKALVEYAHRYDLDPVRDHVVIMYGKPYITLDGYLYHAHQVNHPYKMSSHPLTEEERQAYVIPEGAHAWLTRIIKEYSGSEFTGLGVVTREELTAESKGKPGQLRSPVVAAHPWQMAQKRAEWQALRRAFPIGESEEEKGEAEGND